MHVQTFTRKTFHAQIYEAAKMQIKPWLILNYWLWLNLPRSNFNEKSKSFVLSTVELNVVKLQKPSAPSKKYSKWLLFPEFNNMFYIVYHSPVKWIMWRNRHFSLFGHFWLQIFQKLIKLHTSSFALCQIMQKILLMSNLMLIGPLVEKKLFFFGKKSQFS